MKIRVLSLLFSLAMGLGDSANAQCYRSSLPLERCLNQTYGDGDVLGFSMADVNDDGYPDVATTSYGESKIYILQSHCGDFVGGSIVWTSGLGHYSASMEWGDINGNGLSTNKEWFYGNGLKQLFELAHRPLHRIVSVQVDDEELDASEYAVNLKNGWITLASPPDSGLLNVQVEYVYSTKLDLVITDPYGVGAALYFDAGSGGDSEPDWTNSSALKTITDIEFGDVDNDGDLDLAVGDFHETVFLFKNDDGVLAASAVWTGDVSAVYSLVWGDFDFDGWQDLAVGCGSDYSAVFFNEEGSLSDDTDWISDEPHTIYELMADDINLDGRVDLVQAQYEESSSVYYIDTYDFEDGVSGTAMDQIENTYKTYAVDTCDFDMDGDLDIAWANASFANFITENMDGELETTTEYWNPYSDFGSLGVQWWDVDQDGDFDLSYQTDIAVSSWRFLGYLQVYDGRAVRHVPDEYSTIQEGIDAATDGQMVKVAAGTYYENITMKEGVHVMGESPTNTIIHGTNTGYIVTMNNRCLLDGFTITSTQSLTTAAVYCPSGHVAVVHCLIRDCQTRYGGIYCASYSSPYILNNTIYSNRGMGGVYVSSRASPTLQNNIIVGTTYTGSLGSGAGIYCSLSSTCNNSYNDIWGNDRKYYRCSAGTGDISVDPQFEAGSYTLESASACIDAGNADERFNDPDGTSNDMGFLYYH